MLVTTERWRSHIFFLVESLVHLLAVQESLMLAQFHTLQVGKDGTNLSATPSSIRWLTGAFSTWRQAPLIWQPAFESWALFLFGSLVWNLPASGPPNKSMHIARFILVPPWLPEEKLQSWNYLQSECACKQIALVPSLFHFAVLFQTDQYNFIPQKHI